MLNGDTIFDIDFEVVFEKFMSNTDFPLLAVNPLLKMAVMEVAISNSGVIRFSINDQICLTGAFFYWFEFSLFNNRVPTEPSRG